MTTRGLRAISACLAPESNVIYLYCEVGRRRPRVAAAELAHLVMYQIVVRRDRAASSQAASAHLCRAHDNDAAMGAAAIVAT